jgi:hypothetical protein
MKGLRAHSLMSVVHTLKVLALDMSPLDLDKVIELMRCFPCLEKLYIYNKVTNIPGLLIAFSSCFDMSNVSQVVDLLLYHVLFFSQDLGVDLGQEIFGVVNIRIFTSI